MAHIYREMNSLKSRVTTKFPEQQGIKPAQGVYGFFLVSPPKAADTFLAHEFSAAKRLYNPLIRLAMGKQGCQRRTVRRVRWGKGKLA
jgi:hypothetical protein